MIENEIRTFIVDTVIIIHREFGPGLFESGSLVVPIVLILMLCAFAPLRENKCLMVVWMRRSWTR